jgi:hypothetical protein
MKYAVIGGYLNNYFIVNLLDADSFRVVSAGLERGGS